MITLDKIYKAAHVLKDVAIKTDLILASNFTSAKNLYLKTENLQKTGSFKLRGASFKIAMLPENEKQKGVLACSAGNHAQGVALAAQKYGIKATVFIPATAPLSKVEATRKLGAEIKLIDGVYDDAYDAALKYKNEHDMVFIHPFDDEDVIAGQGTIGLELLEQAKDLDAVVVPVGGGGLISGIAFAIKSLNPDCKVYGVQAFGADSMVYSLKNKTCKHLKSVSTFADGIAVKAPGENTFEICSKYVDEVVTVSDDETATAILTLLERQKVIAEGAGAVSVAAVMFDKLPIKDKNVACIVSGGNIDVNILSRVINRGLLTAGRLSELTIQLLDKPGQLKQVSTIIADLGANVTRVSHNQGGKNTNINDCYLKISMETRNQEHLDEIKVALTKAGYVMRDKK